MITMVVACSSNRVIGKDNTLIWKVPGDLKRFKEITTGHTVVMGRKTYESIGKPLPNRRNVILSRNKDLSIEGCYIYSSISEIIGLYKNDLFVIGGEEIYRQFLPFCDRVELTLIDKEFEGDAFFPELPDNFFEVLREDKECEEFKYSYITYDSFSLRDKDILNEGWKMAAIASNGGSKLYVKDNFILEFNGDNHIYKKEKNALLHNVEIYKLKKTDKVVLFNGDIFNIHQLRSTLKLFTNEK